MKRQTQERKTGDPFLDSLHSIRPSDVHSKLPKKSLRGYFPMIVRIGALLLCLVVLAASLFSIASSILDYQAADEYYGELAGIWDNLAEDAANPFGPVPLAAKNNAGSATPDYGSEAVMEDNDIEESTTVDPTMMLQIKAKLNALKLQNSDLLGWITVPDSRIDYPVVHTTDNEYYLTHSFEKDYLRAGAIFADYRNSKSLIDNYNTVIYGHNMVSGAMFSCISDFFSRSYFKANRYIYIYTEEGVFVYQTFAIRKVRIDQDVSYITTYFASSEDFLDFANRMKNASAVKLNDVEFNEYDRIITLSTCTNAHDANERYCLQAKLVEVRK